MKAFIQIAIHGKGDEIRQKLTDIPEIKEVHMLFGEWDFLTLIEIEDAEQLASFVIENIRKIDGVKLTSTMICLK